MKLDSTYKPLALVSAVGALAVGCSRLGRSIKIPAAATLALSSVGLLYASHKSRPKPGSGLLWTGEVNIREATGKVTRLDDVGGLTDVGELKQKILGKMGADHKGEVPELTCKGQPLEEDGETLHAAGITKSSTIQVTWKKATTPVSPTPAPTAWRGNVILKDEQGRHHFVPAMSGVSVAAFKAGVQMKTGIPKEHQILSYKGSKMDDAKTLGSLGMTAEAVISVSYKSVPITVRGAQGTTFTMTISLGKTVDELKSLIKDDKRGGIRADDHARGYVNPCYLTLQRRPLNDDSLTLSQLGLQANAVIQVSAW